MNRELNYMFNPKRSVRAWLKFYAFLIVGLLIVLYLIIGRLRTYSLPTGQIELTMPYSKYLLGEAITLTVKNNFNSPVFAMNNCPNEPLGIYRLDGDKWVRIRDKAKKVCTEADRRISIPPNGTLAVNMSQWPHLFEKPGKYRAVLFVEYYNALPFQEFEVITPPAALQPAPSTSPSPRIQQGENGEEEEESSAVQTYIVQVNQSGFFNTTSLALRVGDSIRFIYSPPIGDEVIIGFSGSPALGPIKLDHEFTSGTKTFTSAGTWAIKVQDHSGNTLAVTVS